MLPDYEALLYKLARAAGIAKWEDIVEHPERLTSECALCDMFFVTQSDMLGSEKCAYPWISRQFEVKADRVELEGAMDVSCTMCPLSGWRIIHDDCNHDCADEYFAARNAIQKYEESGSPDDKKLAVKAAYAMLALITHTPETLEELREEAKEWEEAGGDFSLEQLRAKKKTS